MKTRIYLPPVPLFLRLGGILSRTNDSGGQRYDIGMSNHLLRDIGLRRAPEGPDGTSFLPF
ncbi:MAG: hypothetical protein KF810_18030 [Rhizobiaceae bacterium]|nr:hypothetical protein [Rhizobiaceae bacterium]